MRLDPGEQIVHSKRDVVRIHVDVVLPLRGGPRLVAAGAKRSDSPDQTLIAALRKAHRMVERERGIPVVGVAPGSPYDRMIQRLAFLAPDLQSDIMAGRQPAGFTLERLKKKDVPIAWSEQRLALGWSATWDPVRAENLPVMVE